MPRTKAAKPSGRPVRAHADRPRTARHRPRVLVLLVTATALSAAGPSGRALAEGARDVPATSGAVVTGLVTDRDTGEPIEGAWIFRATPRETRGADVRRFDRVVVTRSDAQGRFAFDAPPGEGLGVWIRSLFTSTRAPRHHVYHPSYGLVWGREAVEGRVRARLSLRDAHLRKAEAKAFCPSARSAAERPDEKRAAADTKRAASGDDDAMRETLRQVACPPADPSRYQNGQSRASGPVDDRGRRHGAWVFHRSDGSLQAEGDYWNGAAVGDWVFHPKRDR